MYKSKRQKNKSFDWYGLSQRFSIRKYHFGAASVLLGTALILGAAQSTAKAEEATADNKTEAVTSTPKDGEGATSPTNVTLPATEATTGAPVLDKKELSEEEIAKLAAEASKKDDKTSETATTEKSEVVDKEKATLTAPSTDKKADKKDEKKAENPITATKKILEQLTSEAEVLNTTAANYAEKKVEDKSSKEAIAAAVAAAKVEITASKKVLNEKDVTAEQLNLQLQRISSAIEAVYTEMKRAGHIGKVEAVLAGETSAVVNVVAPLTKTAVKNLSTITEEEIRAIEKEVRSSNPGLTDEDTVTVSKEGTGGTAGGVTVTLGAGRLTQNGTNTITFGNTDVVVGTAGTKNVEQLKNSINWFDFANASITYPDETKVSAVKYLNAPELRTVQSPNRGNITGNFTMYREILDSPDKTLIGKRTIDQEVIDKGFAKYAFNRTYNKVNRENNALYEVLQEGMKFNVKTKVEGYELTATVAKLAPKQVKNSVIPTDKNYSRNLNEDGSYDPAYVILKPQDENYSTLGKSGIHTTYRDESGVERKMLTAFASADDGGNVGVTFDLAATFNGRPVAVNAIAADSEDLNGHEFTQFETNGTPWREFMTVQPKNATGGIVLNTNPLGYNGGRFGTGIKRSNNETFSLGYNNDEWKNNTANNEEPGFGSTLFGPFISPQDGGTLPIGLTQNVSRLSVYVNAAGNQTATIGFVVYDGGDAPASYGDAQHIIGTFNKEKDGKQVTATQPYLGDQPADPDFRNTTSEPSGAWVLDDLVHTEKYEEIGLKKGDKISNALGETGTYDIVDGVSVIRVSSTETIAIKQGEIVSINRPKKAENSTELVDVPVRGVFNSASQSVGIGALPDEGEKQLIDPSTGIKEYTLRQATDNEYVLEGIRVNRGVNNDDAYVRAWVDFNNNGKFDQYEASDVVHITKDGTINLSFKNTPQLLDTSVDSIGVRVRIALKEKEILVPTGIASSGEVEDFLTHVVHFPRGTRHRSEGYQGQKQEVNLPTTAMFVANGKTKDSDYKKWAEMEQTIAPKFVLTESTVASAEETGNEVNVTLKGTTVYGGKEVVLKNAKGQTLATAIKVTNPNNGKVEYLTSEYTEYDTKGNKVGVYTLNPEGENGRNTDGPGNLKYTKVTFKPELGYVGTANGVAIRAWDENRNSTGWEATATTIKQAAEDNRLVDKDKISENVNKKTNGRLSMDTVYIPKVIDIKPVGKDETTIDEQGKQQSATPRILDHGTVESINNKHIDEAKVDKSHVLINRHEPIKFSLVKDVPGKTYTEDTKVTKATVLTYEDGGTEEFKPVDKIPGATNIAETQDLTVTGTGNVTVSNVRIAKGTLSTNAVPAGAILEGSRPKVAARVTVLRNGVEVIVNTGEYIEKGDQLVTPLQVLGGDQTTTWKITFQNGDVIPKASANITPRLVSETSVDQLIKTKGDSLILGGKEYVNNNDVIPKGTRTAGTTIDLTTVTLPKATHVNPKTGEVTTVERRYTKVTENEIEIENEGTYTLVPKTSTDAQGKTVYEEAKIIFKPHPSFVGVGTGVTIKQPDTDYDGPVETDKVTKRYGVDYGSAKYTPTVTPSLTATITRKIHYVYEGDPSTAAKDKTPILTIDGKPVANEQTLTYNRDYIVMSQDGQTDKDITVATAMTLESPITVDRYVRKGNQVVKEATTVTELKPGDIVKAGTELKAGTVIVGAWKAINPENDRFTNIISPTLKGYTAEVQLPENEYTKSEKDGVQSHVRSVNQTTVGVYTPTIKDGKVNTQDVGSYEPMVSEVRADDKDNFDVYVYYKADKQVARVVYIDMDAANNANQGVLETHTGSKLEAEKSATDTITKDDTLLGDSATRIKYSTAATIAKYEAMGYELKRDGFTNDDDGNRIVGGRKFDEESVADSANAGEKPQNQTFYVFLAHKRDTAAKTETADVTRTINYKYKADGSKAAESVTETLNFKRNITIDMALAATAFPEDTATFNAENTKATPEEKEAAQAKYDAVVAKYNVAAEKTKEDPTTAEALRSADKNVAATEKALADAKKANNSLVITSESTQAQRDAKAETEAALQAAQEAYNDALTARDTARTNYLAADNSALAKAVITTQQALEVENAKVEAATVKYNEKIKDVNLTAQERSKAIKEYAKVLTAAEKAAEATTAAKTAFTDAKDEEETLNDAKIAEAVKNKAIQDRTETTQAAKDVARHAYYDAVIAKVKEEAKKETPDKNKLAAVSFGEWKALGSTATNLPANEQLSEAEKQSDNAFNHVTSPTIAGYLADKAAIDKTDAIDPLADDYEVDVFYEKGDQRATVKFVESDATGTVKEVTPGVANTLADTLTEVGKTGDNFTTITKANVDKVIAELEKKGYSVVANGFDNPPANESNTTFDNNSTTDQDFVVKLTPKSVPVDPTKPVDPNNNPVDPTDPTNPTKPRTPETTVTPKPTDPVPNDPKGRTYGDLGLIEQVTRTIRYVYEDGTPVEAEKLESVKAQQTTTLTFTRKAKINAVTGEVTYLDANGNATTKEAAPWTPATTDTFNTVNSPVIDTYVLLDSNQKTITGETVVATDKDIAHKVVYKKAGSIKPQIPAGVNPLTPATDTPYPNNPQDPSGVLKPDPTKPTDPTQPNGPTTPVIPEVPGYTPYGPNGKPLEKDPNGGYKVPDLPTDPTQDTPIVYVKNGSQLAITKFVDVDGNGLAPSVVDSGDEGTNFTKDGDVTATINAILARGYEKVENKNNEKPYPTEATDKVFDKDSATNQEFTVTFKAKELPVVPTKPVNPNNEPVDPTDPTNPNKPRDPETSVTPKPEDKVPNDPKGRTYGELGLVEEVTRTINYVKNDGSKASDTVKETLTFTRKAKINAVTGEVTYLDNDGNATTKEAAPWTPVNGDKFAEKVSPSVTNYTPTVEKVAEKTGVTATDEDIVETVVYNPSTTNVDPNPVTPGENPDPNKVVENDPKKRTLKELGLIEEVTHTVHYKLEDGSDAGIADNVQKVTFTRTAKIDSVTGAILEYGKWTPETKEFTAVTTPAKDGYIASAKTSTANANVGATDKDTEETIIYRKLGSYVPVVPAGVTPPADFDKTPKPYPNATPEDPTKPGTPTTTTIPEIPGTTPVGPDGTPLTKNPNGGYDLPPVPTDPTQNTTITYVKDGSQVAVTHFIEVNSATDKTEKGAVAQSIVDTGDTGKAFTKGQSVTDTINALKAKGYTVVENGYPENGTFDADATTNQEYKVLVTVKPVTITPNTDVPNDDPNTPVDPNNPIQPNKPIDPNNPEGPKWTKELIDKLRDARSETVTRTITYKYSTETSELKAEDAAKAGQTAADTVTNTVTFKRPVTIDPVTKEFTYGDWVADNNDTKLEGKADLPVVAGYVATGDVEASKKDVTDVKATDKDITENVVYKTVGKYVPVIPDGITPPANTNVDPKPYNNDPQDGSKVKDPDPTNPVVPGTTTPIVPQIPGTTPVGPDGKPLKPVDSNDLSKGYVPPTPTDPTKDTSIIYVKDGSQVAVVHFVDEKGNSVNESVVETGDTGNTISTTKADAVKQALEAKGYEVVAPTDALYTADKEGFYKEADRKFDAVSDKATGAADEKVPSQQYYVIVKGKERPVDPTKPLDPNNNPVDPTNPTPENPTKPRDPETPVTPKPEDKVPNDPKGRTYGELGLVEEVTRTINYVKNDGTKAAEPVKETLTFTRKAKINAVTGEVTYLDNDGNATTKEAAPWTPVNNDTTFDKVTSPSVPDYTPTRPEVPAKENVTATDEDIVETVVYNPTKVTVTPNDPNVDPEKPLNPNDPNGLKYKDLKLTEEVKRTITYTYADDVADTSKRGTDAALKHETTVSFTRTATVNQATGEVTYGDWTAVNNDTTLEGKTELPVITGYVATGDVESSKNDVANVTATDKDIVEKVVYKDLGKYVPVVPDGTTPPSITDPKYPNNPTDPTKPGEPTTTIPPVDGLTPLDPSTGKPLEPKDPNDLSKGYKPPVPQDPSKDTNIVYVKDGSQVTVVHFVDEDGNAVHTSFVEAGDAGAKFTKAGEVTKVVEELKAAGYAVVPNKAGQAEYPGEAGVFDSVDDKGENGVSQVYYVTVAKTVPVTPTNPENPNEDPKNPKPGDPIDPNKPDGPKWTEDALNKLNNIKSVTRTITYVKDGTDEEVSTTEAPKVTNKVSFTRTAIVNPKDGSVVGYDTNGDGVADVSATDTTSGWAVAGTAKFAEVKSPVVKGYVVKPNQDTQGDLVEADGSKVKASATNLTVDSPNQDLKVRYVPVGTWTPKVPDGETPIDPIPYPNDPKDPGKVVDPNKPTDPNDPNKPSVPVVPHIPGTTPKDPNGNPLKPVDPEDPSKGYVPPTPTTPTENTVIEYVKDDQKAVTKFVDPSGNPIPGVNNIEEKGKSGEPLTKATEVTTEIAKLIAKGYELVSNNYGKDNNGNFDKDSGKDQEYTVVLTPHVEPIKPFDPTNPNDPNKPKPGTPIDPNNPDGPKWTEELIKSLETTKHVTRTISYVDKDGNKVEYTDKDGNKSTSDVTDKVTFTREAKINLVTGKIEYGKWTPVNNDTTFDKVTSPVVPGYVLKDPAQKEVAETTGVTENSKDENIKVVYVPVGKLVPKVPDGVTPPTPTPYDNDPQDPGKVVPPSPTKPTDPTDPNSPKVPVIPHIPGTTPKVPKDPTKPVDPNTNPLVPLKPVDPKDPSKGYEVPPVPTNPGTDTPIVYENDKQKAITNFVDNNGKVVSDPVVDYGESGSKFTKSGDVESKIKELVKKGYIVTSNDYPSADTDRVFDNDKDKDQIFNVKVTPLIVPTDPNSPDKPQIPTDPTKPVGPNNPLKPVTPSNPEPGKPVFPEDPNSPKWPESVKDLVTESSATRTITYVDRDGKQVAATHTETIKFKRTAKVNLVTGDITYGEWTVVGDDTILNGNKLPKVDGYIARGGDIKESQEDIKAEAGKNITQTVVYAKLGSWIPRLPEGQTNVPPTPYPNDPTDPTKPGTDKPKVPYVPGFIPVDPNGNPLKPVDPNDPTKGYEVPDVPADPTQDTPIKYIPVPTPNNGGGNNGGGGGNTPTPQPQPNPTPQPEPSPAPVPVTPETPEQPVAPVTPEQPAEPATPQYMDGQRELPNTGTEANSSLAALGLLGALSGFGLIARKKRKDEE